MSEPNNTGIDQFKTVTTDDFFKFLDKNSVTTNCPMCGNGTFIVSETIKQDLLTPHNKVAYTTLFRHDTVIPTEHKLNYYYLLHCEKCGFNITFSANTVYKWLSEQQTKEGKEETNG
ncbi:hypothetical protein [Citrobacter sedlakii]|uniref:hypothetical protein n=1 Tax=Citrobacter sedlakii TaxID=67826 RepID=UPI001BA753CA|nr:hypothetical protein [Citrobacter sedlakii]EKJ8220717.1 hypothetical protein [Citrobacter sedlakii]QUC31206.1 hypothetical protein JY391_05500 [Citrobacter sedlakii]